MKTLDEIKQRYQTFGDAVIDNIYYQISNNDKVTSKSLAVCMTCLNLQMDQWEKVKIEFVNVKCLRFVETVKIQNAIVFEALLKQCDDKVIVDFFPIQVDGQGKLEEDPNSSFAIHCTALTCEVLS